MTTGVWVLGVGMTRFGRYPDLDDVDLAFEASAGALADAGVDMTDVGVLAAGSVMNRAGLAQQVQQQLGQYGIPVYNVANVCATGATALRTVYMALASGEAEVGLAVGAEQMGKAGLLGASSERSDVYTPTGRAGAIMPTRRRSSARPHAGTLLARGDGLRTTVTPTRRKPSSPRSPRRTTATRSTTRSRCTRRHSRSTRSSRRPWSRPRTRCSCVAPPPTVPQQPCSSPTTFSADSTPRAAAVPIRIAASVLTSDPWAEGSDASPDLSTLERTRRGTCVRASGNRACRPRPRRTARLLRHCRILHYENLGTLRARWRDRTLRSGATQRDGRIPVNPSGGLLSKGHPLGATGLANIFEVTTHLRGEAGAARQVEGARRGMTHVVGLGSSCAVHILERA